jgi:hypothetical protein
MALTTGDWRAKGHFAAHGGEANARTCYALRARACRVWTRVCGRWAAVSGAPNYIAYALRIIGYRLLHRRHPRAESTLGSSPLGAGGAQFIANRNPI